MAVELLEKPKFTLGLRNSYPPEAWFLDEFLTVGEVNEYLFNNALQLGLGNIYVIDHENDQKVGANSWLASFDVKLIANFK